MLTVFRLLAKLKWLRGTRFDIFARSEERRTERRLIAEYEAVIDEIISRLTLANHPTAVELAALPLEIRGFGHIKEANLARAKVKEASLLARLRAPAPEPALAAAE
jgi:indolepyruvate ferredoxin oxidoreductase